MRGFSPAFVAALVHIYSVCEPLRDAPVNDDAVEYFLAEGLIRPDAESGSGYRTTTLGSAVVEHWCKPLTVRVEVGRIESERKL